MVLKIDTMDPAVRVDPRDVAAEAHLSPDELTLIPGLVTFTIVGRGGRTDVIDDSVPLVTDAHGMILPDGRAIVYCRIHDCCGLRIWASAELAAHTHGGYLHRHPAPTPLAE